MISTFGRPSSFQHPTRSQIALGAALALACTLPANAQCGPTVSARFGGEVSAVAQVNASNLLVAHGSEVELYSLSNPSAPTPYSPRRKVALDAPAAKISMTLGSPRAFILLQNGDIEVVTVSYSPLVSIGFPTTITRGDIVDILADGQRLYAAAEVEYHYDPDPYIYSSISAYDLTSGAPVLSDSIEPLTDQYGYDHLVKVGNTVWAGFHELDSAILGVDGINVADPAHLARTAAALTNASLGTFTHVSSMTAVGNNLLVSYLHDDFPANDWLRAVDVTVPTSPTWQPAGNAVTLSGTTDCIAPIGNRIRIVIHQSGVGTWDVSNPAALTWLGAFFDTYPNISQVVPGSSTDYWAAGRSGLMTMNTSNPASVSARSANILPLPTEPSTVRQRGNTTAVLDDTLNVLRLYDYTLPEAQQLRSTVSLPNGSTHLELANLSGGAITLACVATSAGAGGTNAITIIDITNPASPVTQSTISNISTLLLSASGSRLYVFTTTTDFKIIELAQPLAPQIRSTTHYGGSYSDYTCMTSWSNNAVALGTRPYGLWLIDTTNATAPQVSAVWNPAFGYRVNCLTKGNNYLYVNATVGPTGITISDTRLESINVTNMTNPTQRFVAHYGAGFGYPGQFTSLTYVATPIAKFLVGVRQGLGNDPFPDMDDKVVMYELPPGFLTNEGVPFPIANMTLPLAQNAVAPSADGSHILVAGGTAGLYQVAMPTSWAPAFGAHPTNQFSCSGSTVDFFAFPSGNPTSITYQWFRGNVPLANGPTPWGSTISGATTSALEITSPQLNDVWADNYNHNYYSCVASNSCGSTTSLGAVILLSSADFNGDGNIGTDQDIAAFFACLGGNCCPRCGSADFNGDGDIGTDADIASFFRVLAGGPC
jgi:hypothetical protein